MDGIQYNVALSIFFIPYVLAGKKSFRTIVERELTLFRGAK